MRSKMQSTIGRGRKRRLLEFKRRQECLKKECDELAHKAAQRIAMGGFGVLCGWLYLVYRLTFETDLGWDVMEPVTVRNAPSTLVES